jgi:hypothetical protein
MKIYTPFAFAALIAVCASAQTLPKLSPSPSATAGGSATMTGTQTTATGSASPGEKAERATPFHGTVANVDLKAKTFTLGKEKSRTYKITDKTVITRNGQSAPIQDVTVNEEVRGSYWNIRDGGMEVKTLKLGAGNAQEKNKTDGPDKKAKSSPSPSASASSSESQH